MTVCTYCGNEVVLPCKSTRDMEENHGYKECFAALMILGGGEQTDNQRKASPYRRLISREATMQELVDLAQSLKMGW